MIEIAIEALGWFATVCIGPEFFAGFSIIFGPIV